MEIKTSELTGAALDWAVAKATGAELVEHQGDDLRVEICTGLAAHWSPSTSWSQCGPLIDKYKPWVSPPVEDPDPEQPYGWDAEVYDEAGYDVVGRAVGCDSALIAVCRAIVSAKLGDTVDVPEELLE